MDDCSTDDTVNIIESFTDQRIKLLKLRENAGAAKARNTGIKEACGEYLAFLDSDDLWIKLKLEKQIEFMIDNGYNFTSTEYAEMDGQNNISYIVKNYTSLDYEGVLKNCPGNSTIIYNAKKLGKFYVPDIRKRNDYAMWLQVIKKAKEVYGLKETLTIYRVREGSLSEGKANLIKYQWNVYREIEGLSIFKSAYLLIHKILQIITKSNKIEVTKNKSIYDV